MQVIVPVTQHLKGHLKWWLDIANITQGRSLVQWSDPITITKDASKTGFGGHMKNQIYQGLWTKTEAKQHIDILEMEAVIQTIKYFLPQLQGQNVLLRCDNTTVVQNCQRKGGTSSVSLFYKVSKVAKIRNRYNQVPHLTQDTNGKVTNSQKTPQTRAKRSALSQQVTTKHI